MVAKFYIRGMMLTVALCFSLTAAASNVLADTVATYRNFLGEVCLSLPKSNSADTTFSDRAWRTKMTYASLPLLITSVAVKNNTEPIVYQRYNPEKPIRKDLSDYMPYTPYALIAGLKVAGYEGRSATPRLLTAALLSNAMMAVSVKGIKHGTNSYRPDGTDQLSYVSGHAATAFAAATILHKEYGRTRSPWFSVAGYGMAATTSMMRVLNNRHRGVDVLGGAAVGILATELGYVITDRIFGSRQLQRLDNTFYCQQRNPSFVDIQMGAGLHSSNLRFTPSEASLPQAATDSVEMGASAAAAIEGAYFINKYIGFGGMVRLTSTPMKPLNLSQNEHSQLADINAALTQYAYSNSPNGTKHTLPGIYSMYLEQPQMVDVSIDGGVYASLPLTSRLSVGAKALIGMRIAGSVTFTSKNGQPVYDCGETTSEGQKKSYYFCYDANGEVVSVSPQNNNQPFNVINPVLDDATEEFDMLHIDASNAVNAVLGVNVTWRFRDCFACKVFADFDTSKTTLKYTRRFFSDSALQRTASTSFPTDHPDMWQLMNHTERRTLSKRMNHLTIGCAFSVCL